MLDNRPGCSSDSIIKFELRCSGLTHDVIGNVLLSFAKYKRTIKGTTKETRKEDEFL